jgi:hypothetical protein
MERKKFRIQIRGFGYYADFNAETLDSTEAIEQAVLDKIGKNDIVWEEDKFYDKRKCYLTYEEVEDAPRQHGVVR